MTLKIRSGPDAACETAVAVARRAEDAGATAVDVHARSVAQAYVGGPDWSVVTRVKQAVRIPVLGSGGIREAADAIRFLQETGADGAAIGRGCLGNPWIFTQARTLWQTGTTLVPPTRAERGRSLLQLVAGEFHLYGATVARRAGWRTSCYFAKFAPDFATFREAVHHVASIGDFRKLVREHFG